MNVSHVIVHGIIKPNGALEVYQPVNLPPGEVQITVQTLENAPMLREDVWTVLDKIWAAQKTSGFLPRTREQIDASVNAIRNETDEDFEKIERIHLDSKQLAGDPPEKSP